MTSIIGKKGNNILIYVLNTEMRHWINFNNVLIGF
jgi:hypothetical protein